MANHDDAFIRRGVLEYHRQALAVTEQFLRMLKEKLKQVLEHRLTRKDFGRFRPSRKTLKCNVSSRTWVQGQLTGRLDDREVTLGICVSWQNGPDAIFAIWLHQPPGGRLPLQPPPDQTEIQNLADETFLYLQPRQEFDIGNDFNRLIDAALKIERTQEST